MCAKIVRAKELTHQIPTQTLPIAELDVSAPRDDVTRFIIKMLYEADEQNHQFTLDEFVRRFMLFGPINPHSHTASVRELKRAILWLSNQNILYVTEDLHVDTFQSGGKHTRTWLQRATADSVGHFRAGFGQKDRHWFYGNI